MTTIWKYMVTIILETTTYLIQIVGEFAFIIKAHYLLNIKYLQECVSFEIRIGGKRCKFICLSRSSSQSNDEFESLMKNLELALDKIH